jgi:hypothetical protein
MVNRKREISLDDLNPLDLEPTPENVELVRRGLAKIDNNRLVWGGVLAAWERQLGLWTPPPSSLEAIRQPKGNPRPKLNGVPTKQLKLIQGSVTDAVYQILSDASRPMTFRDLEDALRKRGLGHKLLGEKKPHYGAIQRLREAGYCVSHKGRFATPGNFKKYMDAVAAGHTEDVFAPQLRNKWAEAIVMFVESHPKGVTTQEMIAHLNTLPGFVDETSTSHDSYIYGVVGKLVKRDKLLEPCGRSGKSVIYRRRKPENGAAHTTAGLRRNPSDLPDTPAPKTAD